MFSAPHRTGMYRLRYCYTPHLLIRHLDSPLSDEGKNFNREVDDFFDRTGPSMPDLDPMTAALIGEEVEPPQEKGPSEDGKYDKEIGSKADFSIEQYNLYLQYCDIFESSMKDLLSSQEDQNDLYNMLSDAVHLMQTGASDDSLAAVFLEMVEAMSEFQEFYSMMYEAYESESSSRK